jgi:multiple sugar transport system permease protein
MNNRALARIAGKGTFFGTIVGLVVGLVWIFPVYWAVNTALMVDTNTIKVPPQWFPAPMVLDAFTYVLQNTPIVTWYINSVFSSLAVVVVTLFITMLAAYPLSQIRFPGRNFVFVVFLAGFMIPGATNVVPLFMMMTHLGLVNTNWGLILPQLVAPVALVIYKQFFDQMPQELIDAARIDGAGESRILFRIFLPLNVGITWALAIVLFIWTWNNFFWPYIIINSTPKMTIPIGITQVQSWYGIAYSRIMASAVLAATPIAVIYIIFQRKVAHGVAITAGIKG